MVSQSTPLAPESRIPPQSGSQAGTMVDKSGRFHRLQGSFQRQLQGLARDFYTTHRQPLVFTDTVRTQAEQAQAHREKPSLALPAGHPNAMHPRGLAVDVDSEQARLITPEMLAKNGLHLPALSKGETWHIEPRAKQTDLCRTYPIGSFPGSPSRNSATAELSRLLHQQFGPLNPQNQLGLTEPGSAGGGRGRQAAVEVEAIFLEQLLQQSRRAMVDPVSSSSKKNHSYLNIADQHLARSLAAGGGLGLADKILRDLATLES
jgi:hypothetical protein